MDSSIEIWSLTSDWNRKMWGKPWVMWWFRVVARVVGAEEWGRVGDGLLSHMHSLPRLRLNTLTRYRLPSWCAYIGDI